MRDLLITLIVFGALPIILLRTSVGVYLWSWLGYMSPHRLSYGFAYNFPFAAIIGAVTLLSLLVSKEKKVFPVNGITIFWAMLIGWYTVSTFNATLPDVATEQLIKVLKIQIMVVVTMLVIRERKKIHVLVWVITASIGFYGFKGGVFAILTGGSQMVWGPPGSFIYGNNELAFALVMIFPLLRYLFIYASNRWLKYLIILAMLLIPLSILASYSRGAALALALISAIMIIKSKKKFLAGILIIAIAPALYMFMPDKWTNRMDTVKTYEEDSSAMGRIYVWELGYIIATEESPITGGGFGIFGSRYFHSKYNIRITGNSNSYIASDAHSIYFLILGEHGFIGLFLFLALLVITLFYGSWIIHKTKKIERLTWAKDLAISLQLSILGFASAGSFVGQSYFDLYYHLVALMAVLHYVVKTELKTSDNTQANKTLNINE